MATTRETEAFADCLAEDGAAGVQNPRDDSGVDLRHVALKHACAVHHRHASHADVVLDGDRLAGEDARRGAFDFRAPVPGTEQIVLGLRAVAGAATVFHCWSGS